MKTGNVSVARFFLGRSGVVWSLVPLLTLPLAWLWPNHHLPWPSAWQDGAALAAVFAAACLCRHAGKVQWSWLAAVLIAALSVTMQWLTGKMFFGGDALMVLLYVGAFALALIVGAALVTEGPGSPRDRGLDAIALSTLVAALVSVGIAGAQWTGAESLGLWATDLPPGARPFANVSQPNHLCSLLFLALCSALLLKESGRIGRVGFWLAASFLLLGMVISGSRTGWLQVSLLLVLGISAAARMRSSVRPLDLLILTAIYVAVTLAWPALNEILLLTGGRSVSEQIDGGARMPLWLALLDAVRREPLWGYGWQQMVLAQQAVALDHPPVQRHFEHSHNLLLDLLLWAGIPVGLAICAICSSALMRLVRCMTDARALWLVTGVLGLLLHSMLEFPFEYAYFLLPAGFALGAASALTPGLYHVSVPVWALRSAGFVGCMLLMFIALEYLQAEQNHRQLRLESARIGTSRIKSEAPKLRLLTQLSAFLQFARTEARPSMTIDELNDMRQAARRFAYPSSMLRHALGAGLNGHPEEASQTLQRLCSMHPKSRCDEARQSWLALQRAYPVLLEVPAP